MLNGASWMPWLFCGIFWNGAICCCLLENGFYFLGITNFDLLGKFSEVKWLGNFYLVLLYNAVFAVAASLCLFNKFTVRVRQEIVRRWAAQLFLKLCLTSFLFPGCTSTYLPFSWRVDHPALAASSQAQMPIVWVPFLPPVQASKTIEKMHKNP